MTKPQIDLVKGTLDLLILRTLDLGPRHGLGVADRIEQITGGTFRIKPGSLFPALHRLEQRGFITGTWEKGPLGSRGKYYCLTPAGRRQLATEQQNWATVVFAIAQVMEAK